MTSRVFSRRKFHSLLALAVLLLCSGCTSSSTNGTTTTYGYSAWVSLLVAVLGLGIGGYGFYKLVQGKEDGSGPLGGILTILTGGIVLILVAPAFAVAYITVAPEKTVIGGSALWFVPSSTVIDHAKVTDMKTEVTERWTKRGKRKTETLIISFSDGKVERMSQNALVNAALPNIVSAIEGRLRGGAGVNMGGMVPNGVPNNPAAYVPPANFTPAATPGQNSTVQASQANPPGRPVSLPSELQAGMIVSGQAKDGAWYAAKILEVLADGTAKIHYEGYPDQFDEVVPLSKIRITSGATAPVEGTPVAGNTPPGFPPNFPMPPPGFPNFPGAPGRPNGGVGAGGPPPPSSTIPTNTLVATDKNIKQGAAAHALWGAMWYQVKILEVRPGNQVKVHYEGWGDNFDEVVPLSKVRVPK